MPEDLKEQDDRRKGFIQSVAKTTENSPLVAGIRAAGGEVIPRVIAHRHQAFWNASKDHVLGSEVAILTDLGKLRQKNPNVWRSGKAVARKAVDRAPPSMSAHMENAFDKMEDTRGILDVESFTKKVSEYRHTKVSEVDPSAMRLIKDATIDVFNHYGDEMRKTRAVRIEDIQKWIVQLNPNRNSGNPDYTPVSKEQAVSEYWPVMRNAIIDVVKNGNMTPKLPPYTDNVYAGFHRSPNRPIHGAGIFDKLIGAYFNFHIVEALRLGTRIAWENLDDMFIGLSEAMSKGESSMHDDFDAYDNHFGPELNLMIHEAFLESSFLDHSKELHNAFNYFCHRLTANSRGEDVLLQLSPTHAFRMRDSLFSGTPVTQFWGCIFHDAFYKCLEDNFGFGIIDARVLSDDGIAIMETDAAESSRLMDTYARTLAEQLGHELSPAGKKSYIADFSITTQMHDQVEIETHDMGPFLQFYPQMAPANSFGNVPRRIYSLFERERDSSDATRLTMLNQFAPSLARQKTGSDKKVMANWVADLHRSMDVIATVRPRYPRMRELLVWFTRVYPNFWKKFSRLHAAADESLWEQNTLMAGGTREGENISWIHDYFLTWGGEGSAPRIDEII